VKFEADRKPEVERGEFEAIIWVGRALKPWAHYLFIVLVMPKALADPFASKGSIILKSPRSLASGFTQCGSSFGIHPVWEVSSTSHVCSLLIEVTKSGIGPLSSLALSTISQEDVRPLTGGEIARTSHNGNSRKFAKITSNP
jgi:hypothetical protein